MIISRETLVTIKTSAFFSASSKSAKNFESRGYDSILIIKNGSEIDRPIGKVRTYNFRLKILLCHKDRSFERLGKLGYHMHESVSPAFCFVIKSALFQFDSAKFHIKINVLILKFKIIRRELVKSFAKVCKIAMKSGGKMAVGG